MEDSITGWIKIIGDLIFKKEVGYETAIDTFLFEIDMFDFGWFRVEAFWALVQWLWLFLNFSHNKLNNIAEGYNTKSQYICSPRIIIKLLRWINIIYMLRKVIVPLILLFSHFLLVLSQTSSISPVPTTLNNRDYAISY